MLQAAKRIGDQLVAWRRDFHMYPELSFQETRTARLVAQSLTEMGIEIQTGVAKTGVVGYLGEGGPVVAIRADMDALPIQEANPVPYASQHRGIMHACGHDAHTAILLGVARLLSQMEDRPPGQIRFLFQPSEESRDPDGIAGATRMIEDGALDGVDSVIALHVMSQVEANRIEAVPGLVTAHSDSFEATITGTGGHGAMPHQGTDPVFMAAQVLNAIFGIRARRLDPTKEAIISIGSVHAGTAPNVIPSEVQIKGTLRSYDDQVRAQQEAELTRAFEVARALGGDYSLQIIHGVPSTYNDPQVAAVLRETTADLLGEEALIPQRKMLGGEDFSFMTRRVPGAMFILGARKDEVNRPHHTPVFDIAEEVLPTGAAILAEAALRLLRKAAERP